MTASLRILATGGTIAGVSASAASSTDYTAAALGVDALLSAVPALHDVARVDGRQIAAIDSRNATPSFWQSVAQAVQAAIDDPAVDGVVVTHGTDTLEETAFYLHLTLKGRKPVVLTAAMRPSTSLSADGPLNLLNAARVAADPRAAGRGVLVAVNHQVHSARGVRKWHTMRPDAFGPADTVLGHVHDDTVSWHAYVEHPHTADTPFSWQTALPQVDVLLSYAGAPAALVGALRAGGARGIVLAGSGNGAASDAVLAELRQAAAEGVAVVRASRVATGAVRRVAAPEDAAIVDAGSLNPFQSRILLMLALGQGVDVADAFATY